MHLRAMVMMGVLSATACGKAEVPPEPAASDAGGKGATDAAGPGAVPSDKSEAPSPSTPTASGALKVGDVLGGRISLPMTKEMVMTAPEDVAIRDQAGLDALISSIPTEEITQTQPAGPSDDPLLKKPAVDFNAVTLLVAYRAEDMYARAQMGEPKLEGDTLVVPLSYPPGEMGASQLGIGTYTLKVVPRHDGPVRFAKP